MLNKDMFLKMVRDDAVVLREHGVTLKKHLYERGPSFGNEPASINATAFHVVATCNAIITGTDDEALAKKAIVLADAARKVLSSVGSVTILETLFDDIDEFTRTLETLFPESPTTSRS